MTTTILFDKKSYTNLYTYTCKHSDNLIVFLLDKNVNKYKFPIKSYTNLYTNTHNHICHNKSLHLDIKFYKNI
jgi:hypothetical protein